MSLILQNITDNFFILNGLLSLFISCIELILLVNLLIFSQKNNINKLAILLVFLLMLYQSIEFIICGLNQKAHLVAYLAFVDISFLPPLNLISVLCFTALNKKRYLLLFIFTIFFIVYYGITINHFEVIKCTSFYAVYNYPLGEFYGAYYYLPIIASIIILVGRMKKEPDKVRRKLTLALLTGHIIISVPVVLAFILILFKYHFLLDSVESIMCKFAFGYALCLSYFSLNSRLIMK